MGVTQKRGSGKTQLPCRLSTRDPLAAPQQEREGKGVLSRNSSRKINHPACVGTTPTAAAGERGATGTSGRRVARGKDDAQQR